MAKEIERAKKEAEKAKKGAEKSKKGKDLPPVVAPSSNWAKKDGKEDLAALLGESAAEEILALKSGGISTHPTPTSVTPSLSVSQSSVPKASSRPLSSHSPHHNSVSPKAAPPRDPITVSISHSSGGSATAPQQGDLYSPQIYQVMDNYGSAVNEMCFRYEKPEMMIFFEERF
jgi:hypothetical protein